MWYDSDIYYGVWAVIIFGLLHNIWATWNIIWSLRWVGRGREKGFVQSPAANIVILLPMYQEKRMAQEALAHFANLNYPKNQFHLVVITTAREDVVGGENTTSVVGAILNKIKLENAHLFEADGTDFCKADQLNQALSWLGRSKPAWWTHDTIVGVYDADSRPEHTSLLDVAAIEGRHPGINLFQQPSLYLTNFYDMPPSIWRKILQSRPLYNLRFCLCRELPGFFRSVRCLQYNSFGFSLIARSPNHLLGHGEFIRRRTLEEIGGFPPPSGDTSLGTVLSFKGEAVYPLSTFDLGESPNKIGMLAFQGANWYAGCAHYMRDLRLALNSGCKLSAVHFVMCFKRWLENMIWCVGPILWLLSLLFSIGADQKVQALLCVLVFMLHGVSLILVAFAASKFLGSLEVEALRRKPRLVDLLYVVPFYPLMLIIACSGPLLFYWHRLRTYMNGGVLPRWKTNRDG